MKDSDKRFREIAARHRRKVPELVHQRLEDTLSSLPAEEKAAAPVRKMPRLSAIAAGLVLVILVVLPNVSPVYARAMEQIPVIGSLVRVVTIRNYLYSDDYHRMNVEVPHITDPEGIDAVDRINQDVETLTEEIIRQFYRDVESIGDQGHTEIAVDYDVVTNTERWFTLKLSMHFLSGSGSSQFKFYNMDRTTGELVSLGDLFSTEDFAECIKTDILAQMRQRTEADNSQVYHDGTSSFSFSEIGPDHNFYFDQNGNLVIPFDKYEAAPGYMGCPEFVISEDAIAHILKEEYQDIS